MEDETDSPDVPRAMIGLEMLLELVPVSQSTMQRMERRGTFPSSRIIAGRKLWFADEVARWQRNLSSGPRRSPRVSGSGTVT